MRPLAAPHNGAWMRAAEPRPADPVLLAALTDAWIPAAFAHMEQPTFVPTIDLTIHWRAAPGVPAGEHPWVLGRVHAPASAPAGRGRRTASCGARTASCSPSRASSRSSAARGDRPPRARLQRRRPPRQPAGRGRRAARATACACSPSSSVYDTEPVGEVLDQPEFLNAVVRIETDARARRRCSTRARRSSASSGARRAACATGRGRSTSTCCCSATWPSSRSACSCRTREVTVAAVRARAAARGRPGRRRCRGSTGSRARGAPLGAARLGERRSRRRSRPGSSCREPLRRAAPPPGTLPRVLREPLARQPRRRRASPSHRADVLDRQQQRAAPTPIWRSAALGCSPPITSCSIQRSTRCEVVVERARGRRAR